MLHQLQRSFARLREFEALYLAALILIVSSAGALLSLAI